MIKVYIAAPFQFQEMLRTVRDVFHTKKNLFQITSSWLDVDKLEGITLEGQIRCAQQDYRDISNSSILVVFNPVGWENKGTGGRHLEVGYALGLGIPVVSYGSTQTVMYHHPLISKVDPESSWILVMDVIEKVYVKHWQSAPSRLRWPQDI